MGPKYELGELAYITVSHKKDTDKVDYETETYMSEFTVCFKYSTYKLMKRTPLKIFWWERQNNTRK